MDIKTILHRHAGTHDASPHADSIDDRGAFGTLRGVRDRATMIEFRKKDGSVLSLPYPAIEQILYTPDDGIRIRAGGRDIHLTGRNLNSADPERIGLLVALSRQLVLWIQETPRSVALDAEKTRVTIDSISW